MLRNIFKSSFYRLIKELNVRLLSLLSFVVSILLLIISFTLINKEFTRNLSFEKAARIYRIDTDILFKNGTQQGVAKINAFAGPVVQELPFVVDQTRVDVKQSRLEAGEEVRKIEVARVDTGFFNVFNHEFLEGNDDKVFYDAKCITISQKAALSLFNSTDIIGQIVTIDSVHHTICGVFVNNSTDIDFDYYGIIDPDDFDWVDTYIALNEQISTVEALRLVNNVILDGMEGQYDSDAMKLNYVFTDLAQLHFSDKLFETARSNPSLLIIFIASSILLLVISTINYTILEVSLSAKKAISLMIRRIYGSNKTLIFVQTLFEVSITYMISILLSVLVLYGFFHEIINFLGVSLSVEDVLTVRVIGALTVLLIIFAFTTAGIAYRVNVTYEKHSGSTKALKDLIPNYYLPLQTFFSLSTVLFAYFAHQQLKVIANPEVGFDYDQVVIIDFDNDDFLSTNLEALKHGLYKLAAVEVISAVDRTAIPGSTPDIQLFSANNQQERIPARNVLIDTNYFNVLKIPFKTERKKQNYKNTCVINDEFKKSISVDEVIETVNGRTYSGTVPDFYQDGIYSKPEPMAFFFDRSPNTLLVRYSELVNPKQIEDELRQVVSKFNNDFTILNLRQLYLAKNISDIQLVNLLYVMTFVIIIVSVFGLFAIISFIYSSSLKSIAVRRLLGASVRQIANVMSRYIIRGVLIASAVTIPVTYYLLNLWLRRFEVKLSFDWIDFLIVIPVLLLFAGIYYFMVVFRINKINLTRSLKEN